MNRIYRTLWSVSRQCYVVAAETCRAKGKSGSVKKGSVLLKAAGVVLGGVAATGAFGSDITSPVSLSKATPDTPLTVTVGSDTNVSFFTAPAAGPAGFNGRVGWYNCNQMSWGAACANWYSFGSYRTSSATNGGNAPSGQSAITFSVTNPSVADLVLNSGNQLTFGEIDPALYTINVTQLASGQIWSTGKSNATITALTPTSVLNGGNPFSLVVTPETGGATPITIYAGSGTTLQRLSDLLNPAVESPVLGAGYSTFLENTAPDALEFRKADTDGKVWSVFGPAADSPPPANFTQTPPPPTYLNNGNAFNVSLGSNYTIVLGANSTLENLQSGIANLTGAPFVVTRIGTELTIKSTETFTPSAPTAEDYVLRITGPSGSGNNFTPIIRNSSLLSFTAPTSTDVGSVTIYSSSASGSAGVLNGGAGFTVVVGSQTIDMPANSTLANVATEIDKLANFNASISGTTLTVNSTENFSSPLVLGGADTRLAFSLPDSNASLYDPNAVILGRSSQSALYTIEKTVGGATSSYTASPAPENVSAGSLVIGGAVVRLTEIGSSNLTISSITGAVTGGVNGNVASPGLPIEALGGGMLVESVGLISVPGSTAYVGNTTAGQAGTAQVGGAGGQGGAGGNADTQTVPRILVIVFPPLTIPDTDAITLRGGIGGTGAQGATGGNGLTGGSGGLINFSLTANQAIAGSITAFTSTGGQGGTGGLGGSGGLGGNGGNAAAQVESENLLPVVRSALGNTGGVGGIGGRGGNGGVGGEGGNVSISTSIAEGIVTNGHFASSVGGKGGTGGQGGQGGTGGTGGQGAALTVTAVGSRAENGSQGGRGGEGFTGGDGGRGGNGANVSLLNQQGSLVASSIGLFALSQGGEGGTGGQGGQGGTGGTGGDGKGASNLGLNEIVSNGGRGGDGYTGGLGGVAGKGGDGGTVSLVNNGASGSIVAGVNAIHAASRGGIGGTGGKGGTGGTGGTGGLAGVESPIANSFYAGKAGLSGQGGDGGDGGDGGAGAAGGDGGEVAISNAQSLRTTGQSFSSAILGESLGAIGGLGGAAGEAGAVGLGGAAGSSTSNATGIADSACTLFGGLIIGGVCSRTLTWAAGAVGAGGNPSLLFGATNVTGGHGGVVTISNTGNTRTVGSNSDAILAISMGGVHGLSEYNPNNVYRNGLVKNLSNTVVSQTGAAGNVAATNTNATIVTTGDRSSALMALSVGAGYGSGTVNTNSSGTLETFGNDSPAMVAASRVYQLGSTTGDLSAKNVVAKNIDGEIVTRGAGSDGVRAESWSAIGAAGAVTVDNSRGNIFTVGSGNTSAIYALSHSAADSASDVSISNANGTIVSQAGGLAFTVYARSISDSSSSGAVSFDNRGGYLWSNSAAGAVYLESNASATSGNIGIDNASSIISTAFGSVAVTQVSEDGNLTLSNGGLIKGGATGSAIKFIGGVTNTITNDGGLDPLETAEISTFGTVQDFVITATSGNNTINNLRGGFIRGSIDLGGGVNAINNNSTGPTAKSLIEAGSVIDLGGGNFNNGDFGYLSPGGLGVILSPDTQNSRVANQLVLNGDFNQSAQGHLVMDVNFATGESRTDFGDFIAVNGTANLGGFVTLNPSTGAGKQGTRTITLMSSTGTMTNSGIAVHPFFANADYSDGVSSNTAIFTPMLSVDGNNLNLSYTVNYTPNYLTPNQGSVADEIIKIQDAGVPSYQPIAAQLLSITNPVDYQTAIDSLSGEGVASSQQMAFSARSQFTEASLSSAAALLECDAEMRAREPEVCEKGYRQWVMFKSSETDQDGNLNEAASRTQIDSAFGGFESRVFGNSVLGFSAGYSRGTASIPTRFYKGSSDSLSLGLYWVTQAQNGLGLKAIVSAGLAQNSYERYAMGNLVKGDSDSASYGYGLEVFYNANFAGINFTPFVSLGQDRLNQNKHEEDDVLWGNDYKSHTVTSRPVSVGFSVDAKIRSGEQIFSPKLRYAVRQETASRDRTIRAASLAAPGFYWTLNGVKPPKEEQMLELDLRFRITKYTQLSLQASQTWSETSDSKAGSIKFEHVFD